MEQKIYKYEVILNLKKGNNHLRKIAKDLGINHMTIKRLLDHLVNENVLDVNVQGRNNIFSIKKTIEARNYTMMSELYKFNIFIQEHPELRKDIEKIQEISEDLIIIYGSFAKFKETNKSDIDIYIKTRKMRVKQQAEKINSRFSVKIGPYDRNNLLIREIEKDHIIIKGVELFYEKNQFFSQSMPGRKDQDNRYK